jgi:hypothetical protein
MNKAGTSIIEASAVFWSKILLDDGYESRQCDWLRAIFCQIFEAAAPEERAELGLYVARQPIIPVALYFSPLATARMRAAAPGFAFIDCDSPQAAEVDIVHGVPFDGLEDGSDALPWHVEAAA